MLMNKFLLTPRGILLIFCILILNIISHKPKNTTSNSSLAYPIH